MNMPLASEVAQSFRELAGRLDAQPDIDIPQPTIWLRFYEKNQLTCVVHLLPRPLKKSIFRPESAYPDLHIEYNSDPLRIVASIPQSASCTLIEPARPARYACEPILSPDEEAAITEA
jgi:hypothetical protein